MSHRKVYAIYCRVVLDNEPDWLKDFRAKYDKPYDLHITLKQMSYIDESAIADIRAILKECLEKSQSLKALPQLEFDTLAGEDTDPDTGKGMLYIFASKRNHYLDQLQFHLRQSLSHYSDYYLQESARYESDFQPHITIGRDLDDITYQAATRELPGNITVNGTIESIVLSCLDETRVGEIPRYDELSIFEVA